MTNDYITEGVAEYVVTLFPEGFKGICVDIGAYDPFWISNSWIFEEAGWDTYCIEPNSARIPKLKQFRKNVLEYACGDHNEDDVNLYIYKAPYAGPADEPGNTKIEVGPYEGAMSGEAACTGLIRHSSEQPNQYEDFLDRVIKVKVRTLDWLMENEIKQDHIDLLSIDVELNEMTVLKGTDLKRWNPLAIIIENQTPQDEVAQLAWLTELGYSKVNRIGVNDVYTRNEQ